MNLFEKILEVIVSVFDYSLIFINLVDFDEKYGYCCNVVGYVKVLKEFDDYLLIILN